MKKKKITTKMKQFILLLSFLLIGNASFGQCGTAGVTATLTSQTEINDFQSTLGSGCTDYLGSITILDNNDGTDDILNLNSLSFLTSMGGDLEIIDNHSLIDITGLSGSTSISGNLYIAENDSLANLTGLSGLTSMGGDIDIIDNISLLDINGLSSLTSISGYLYIADNNSLVNLTGLSGLTSIGGDLDIFDNNSLLDITGLSGLTSISGNLNINGITALVDLTGLSSLTSIGGTLRIVDNTVLADLTGLSGLTSIGGDLDILDNLALNGLDDYCGLYTVLTGTPSGLSGSYNVSSNGTNPTQQEIIDAGECLFCGTAGVTVSLRTQTKINNFQSTLITGCTDYEGNITIKDITIGTDNITNLDALSFLTSVAGLDISSNNDLANLTGLSGLTSISGDLSIVFNPVLNGLDDYCGLYTVLNETAPSGLIGTYSATNNGVNPTQQEIVDAGECPACGTVGVTVILTSQTEINDFKSTLITGCIEYLGNITIADNDDGTDDILNLDSLSFLNNIVGNLNISNNPVLADLTGLSSLTNIGGDLQIEANDALADLIGLSDLELIGGDLTIIENVFLNSLDDYCGLYTVLSESPPEGLSGTYSVVNNGLNPTQQEIIDAEECLVCGVAGEYVSLSTQTQINDFQSTLVAGCTEYLGDIDITESDNETDIITDLTPLSFLTSIAGSLTINNNSSLTDITGLSGLTSIGEFLYIHDNTALVDISGLSSLTSIGKDLSISDNPILTDISGLSGLTSIGEDLRIDFNPTITDISGLSSLTSIGINLTILTNPALTNLTGLSDLMGIGGDLDISNTSLNVLVDYCWLYTVLSGSAPDGLIGNYSVSVNELNPSQQDIIDAGGCPSFCGETGDAVTLTSQTEVNDFQNSLIAGCTAYLGNIEINDDNDGTDNITDLVPLSFLTNIGGYLKIAENDFLVNVDSLSSLKSIGGDLIILDNDGLANLRTLPELIGIGGDLNISTNPTLNELGDYCGLFSVLSASSPNGLIGDYTVADNGEDPTQQGIIDAGECLLLYCAIEIDLGSCMGPETVIDCDDDGMALIDWAPPTASIISADGTCSSPITITQTGGPLPGTVQNLGTYNITYVAQSVDLDNFTVVTATCNFDVVVAADTEAPVLDCAASYDVEISSTCDMVMIPDLTEELFTDDCIDYVTVTQDIAPGMMAASVGTPIDVTVTFTDAAGNSANCVVAINPVDTINPTITICASDQNVFINDGTCEGDIPDLTGDIMATDDCGILSIVQNPASGTFGEAHGDTILLTFTVIDNNDNESTCTTILTLVDEENPEITVCATNMVVDNDPGECFGLVPDLTGNITATDNCTYTTTQSPVAGMPFGSADDDTQVVTITITDDNSNTDECTVTLTLNDNEAPVISTCAADQDVPADAACLGTVIDLTGDAALSAIDNCTGVTYTQSPVVDMTFSGSQVVTITANDANGNSSTCMTTLTAVDGIAPSMDCASVVSSTTTVVYDIMFSDLSGGSVTAICLPQSYGNAFTNIMEFDWESVNTNTAVSITMEYFTGLNIPNSSMFIQLNGIPGSTFAYDSGCSVLYSYSWDISNYNSGVTNSVRFVPLAIYSLVLSPNPAWGGAYARVTVEYADDVTSTISFTTSEDGIIGDCQYTVSDTSLDPTNVDDNCDASPTVTNDLNNSNTLNGASFPLDTTTVTWTVTDETGNSYQCTTDIIITDDEVPTITCDVAINVNVDPGTCSYASDQLTAPPTGDNCGVASVVASPASLVLGANIVTWTVTDDAGLTATCTQEVTVIDNIVPTITCDAAINVNVDAGTCTYASDQLTAPTTGDNCGVANVVASPASLILGANTVTWTVTDDAGLTATCTQEVTVIDNEAPSMDCADDNSFTSSEDGIIGDCQYTVPDTSLDPTNIADNCDTSPTVTNDANNSNTLMGVSFDVGASGVTWTITDASGNSYECEIEIVVTDDEDPFITCGADKNINVNTGTCEGTVPDLTGEASASDNCDDDEDVVITQDIADNTTFGAAHGDTQDVILTATDEAGNTSTCTVTLTLVDDINPTVTCAGDADVSLDDDCELTVPDLVTGSDADDNCTIMDVTQSPTAGTLLSSAHNMQHTVTITTTDVAGNFASCEVTLTGKDVTAPVAMCADITITLDENGMYTLDNDDLTDLSAGSADNCTIASVTSSQMDFTCVDAGISGANATTVTITVTDAAGNTDDCTAGVYVTPLLPEADDATEDAICSDIEFVLDLSGYILGSGILPQCEQDCINLCNQPCIEAVPTVQECLVANPDSTPVYCIEQFNIGVALCESEVTATEAACEAQCIADDPNCGQDIYSYSWTVVYEGGITGQHTGINTGATITDTVNNVTGDLLNAIYTVTPITSAGCEGESFTITQPIEPEPVVADIVTEQCSFEDIGNSANLPSIPDGSWRYESLTIASGLDAQGGGVSTDTSAYPLPSATGGYPNTNRQKIKNDYYSNFTLEDLDVVYTIIPISEVGCEGDPLTVTVTIHPEPVGVDTTYTVCNNEPWDIDLTAFLTNDPTEGTYFEYFRNDSPNNNDVDGEPNFGTVDIGDNFVDAGAENNTNSPQVITYTITPISNINDCLGFDFELAVTILPTVTAIIDPNGDLGLCDGEERSLTGLALPGGNYDYKWGIAMDAANSNVGPSISLSGDTTTILTLRADLLDPSVDGQVNIYFKVNDSANGCLADSVNVIFTIFANPMAGITSDDDDNLICGGESVMLTATGGGSYLWNDLLNSTSDVITVSPATTRAYLVTVTNANGCTDVESMLINVLPQPNVPQITDNTVCVGATTGELEAECEAGGGEPTTYTIAIDLLTDEYGYETSWDLFVNGFIIAFSEADLEANTAYSDTYEVVIAGGLDIDLEFIIYDTADDGICCDYGDGEYAVFVNGTEIGQGGEFEYSETVNFMETAPILGGGCVVEWYDELIGGNLMFTSGSTSIYDPILNDDVDGSINGTYNFYAQCICTDCPSERTEATLIVAGTLVNITSSTATFCEFEDGTTLTADIAGGTWSGNGITNNATGEWDPETAEVGVDTIIYTYFGDVCNTTDTLVLTVVADDDAPVIADCPMGDITVSVDNGTCNYFKLFTEPTASEDCGDVTTTTSGVQSFYTAGTYTLTYTFMNEAGMSSVCEFDLIVEDQENPTFGSTFPVNQIVSNDAGLCTAEVSWTNPFTNQDNCTLQSMTVGFSGATTITTKTYNGFMAAGGQNETETFNKGETTITFTLTDNASPVNTAVETITITINDDENPSFVGPEGATLETMTDLANCPADAVIAGVAVGAVTSGTSFSVAGVAGFVAPSLVAIGDILTVGQFKDNCPDVILSITNIATVSGSSESCGTTITITWQIEDCGNNIVTQDQVFVIDDTTAPTGTDPEGTEMINACANETEIDALVLVSDDEDDIESAYTDECSAFSATFVSQSLSGSACAWSLERTFNVEDACGNTTTAIITHSGSDQDGATFNSTLPQDATYPVPASGCIYTASFVKPTAIDDCSSGTVTATASNAIEGNVNISDIVTDFEGDFPIGENTVTITATDECGNSEDYEFIITITDETAPTISCPAAAEGICDISEVPPFADGAVGAAAFESAGGVFEDNCALDVSSFKLLSEMMDENSCPKTYTRTYQISDAAISPNTNTCTQIIVIDDNILPKFTFVPPSITVECSASTDPTDTGIATGTDNCTANPTISHNDVADLSGCGGYTGTITRTWKVVDGCNNEFEYIQVITIEDTTVPELPTACMDITINLDGNGVHLLTNAEMMTITTGVSDACADNAQLTYTATPSTFDCASIASATSVTVTVTDPCGLSSSCTVNVTAVETIDPEALCPATTLILELNAEGMVTLAENSLGDDSSTDNCTVADELNDEVAYTCADLGDQSVTLTAVDNSGNTNSISCTISIVDNIAPVAICPSTQSILELDANGMITLAANSLGDNSSTDNDNCTAVSETNDAVTYTCADLGEQPVTMTATDGSGNLSSITCMVLIVDKISPSVTCQDITVTLDAETGVASISASDLVSSSSDNCTAEANLLIVAAQTEYTCADSGENIILLTVTDGSGNTATCEATVTVEEDIETLTPTLGGNVTKLDIEGEDFMPTDMMTVDNDNAGEMFLCTNEGIALSNITYTPEFEIVDEKIQDGCGHQLFFNIALSGATSLLAIPLAYENYKMTTFLAGLDVGGGTFPLMFVNSGAADSTIVITLTPFFKVNNTGTFDSGIDHAGLPTIMTIHVTSAPVAICTPKTVYLDSDGAVGIDAAEVDGGSMASCGIEELSIDVNSFDCSNIGMENEVVLTVTDNSGNTSTCTAIITVLDEIAPNAMCKDTTLYLNQNGLVNINASDINDGSTDACGIAFYTMNHTSVFDCDDIGSPAVEVVLTVTDNNSNSATCTANVTVLDTLAPVFVDCMENDTMDVDFLECSAAITLSLPTVMDNCDSDIDIVVTAMNVQSEVILPVTTTNSTFDVTYLVGDNVVTITATDDFDNISVCTFTKTIEDNEAPFFVGIFPDDDISATATQTSDGCGAMINLPNVSADDWCPGAYVLTTVGTDTITTSVAYFPVGISTVIYTALDAAGNMTQDSIMVEVTGECEGTTDLFVSISFDGTVFEMGESKNFIVNLLEIGNEETSGSVQFAILNTPGFTLTFDDSIETIDVGGDQDVNNPDWTITTVNAGTIFTYNGVISAFDFRRIGITLMPTTSGSNVELNSQLIPGSGTDTDITNNTSILLLSTQF